ncbi:MAG: HAD family hydrolase [Thermoplasmata archaeon]
MALAVDLDRTLLPPSGKLPSSASSILQEARAMGLRVILASGREYDRLMPWAHALRHVDAVVAENGAVIESPIGAPRTILGRRASTMARRCLAAHPEIIAECGDVVISVQAADGPGLAPLLAGLPVHLVENVDRWMVLPLGLSKASGVRRALSALGEGRRSYAAIGDAKNDLEMLRGATLSGAVGNAEPEVAAIADYHCRGSCADGVAEFIRGPLAARIGAGDARHSVRSHPIGKPSGT